MNTQIEPESGFQVAFNMLDTDGNAVIDKEEFMVVSISHSALLNYYNISLLVLLIATSTQCMLSIESSSHGFYIYFKLNSMRSLA